MLSFCTARCCLQLDGASLRPMRDGAAAVRALGRFRVFVSLLHGEDLHRCAFWQDRRSLSETLMALDAHSYFSLSR